MVNIVTNHIEKFRKIEKQIFEEDGIMITIGNNKRKGLAKSEIILNIDFPTELINQYHIYEKAIILNIKYPIKIVKKRFNGINLNDYDISFKKTEEFEYENDPHYKNCEIYETQINQKQSYSDLMKQLQKDQVEVTKLVGINNDFINS